MASEAQPSLAGQKLHLIDLPADIHQIIVRLLKTHEPLFPPSYGADECRPEKFNTACDYYYGKSSVYSNECARGLMSWSLTCRYFRQFIAPELYNTVVLENNLKSIERIRNLSQSPYWSAVHSLIFVTSDDQVGPDYNGPARSEQELDDEIARTIQSNMDNLTSVLGNLPPNLESLTLDFRPACTNEDNPLIDDLSDDECYTNDDRLREVERLDHHRAQVKTAITCVGQYDISTKPAFEFRLHNLTPLRSSAYDLPAFHTFLSHVTSFTFSPYRPDDCFADFEMYSLNTISQTFDFASRLPAWFFNHLSRATHFNFHCSSSWPFGLDGDQNFIELPFSETSNHFPNLTHLSLEQVFIDDKLARFITSRFSTLESLSIQDCYAGNEQMGDGNYPTWAQFFQSLSDHSDPRPRNLVSISIGNPTLKLQDLVEGYKVDRGKQIREILKKQRQEELARFKSEGFEACRDSVHRRRRKVFSYAYIDDEYGAVYQGQIVNGTKFLDGDDYRSWMVLVEIVEENIERVMQEKLDAVGQMSISQRQQQW